MKYPNSVDPQFLDANGVGGMNAAYGTVSGAVASTASGAWAAPGLLAPEAATYAFSGLTVTATLSAPWGVVSSGGVVARAHGTVTGQDTQTYSVNFTSVVPASGSITAYLAATIQQIQQNPFPVPGPPAGFPSFNPNYAPTIGYASNVYTVALTAVTGGIDNITTFELLRTTLTAAQTGVTSFSTQGWIRAPLRAGRPLLTLTSGGLLSPLQAQNVLAPSVSGLTFTLPAAVLCGGLSYNFLNPTTGAMTLAASGADIIAGFDSVGLTSFLVPPSGFVALYGNAVSGQWQIAAASTNLTPHGIQVFLNSGTFTVPMNVTQITVEGWAGGGGGAGTAANTTGCGGGGGAYGYVIISSLIPGSTISVTIPAAAAGGAGGNNNGATGGTCVFGSYLSIPGGVGGNFSSFAGTVGGAAPAPANGFGIAGGATDASFFVANSPIGKGGDAPRGGAGGLADGVGPGNAGNWPGGGGGPGMSATVPLAGGAGARGGFIVTW